MTVKEVLRAAQKGRRKLSTKEKKIVLAQHRTSPRMICKGGRRGLKRTRRAR